MQLSKSTPNTNTSELDQGAAMAAALAKWALLLLVATALLSTAALADDNGKGGGDKGKDGGDNGKGPGGKGKGEDEDRDNGKGGGRKSPPPPPHHPSPPPLYRSSPPPPYRSSPPPPLYQATPPPPQVPSPPPPVASYPPPPPAVVVSSPPPPVPSSPPPPAVVQSPPPPPMQPASPPPPVVFPSSPPPPPSPVPVPPPPPSSCATCAAPATCPKRCPQSCHLDCNTCKTVCDCNLPGAVCEDPRFIGGDGNTFYFHGRKDRDFCLLSDTNLHINAHFIGSHVPGLKRQPTWVQAIAVQFPGAHRLYVGALKTATWDDEDDRLAIVFDGEPVELAQGVAGARWNAPSSSSPSLSVTRTRAANGVVVELAGVFKITATVVPITEEDSRVHNYGLREGDTLAHLDLAFKFCALTDDVHGVLGQTYRRTYVNRLDVSAKMPVMGGERDFAASGLFATDCAVARFAEVRGSRGDNVIAAAVDSRDELIGGDDVKCSTGIDGVGVVCKK